jgi:hypothetical protein
VQRDASIRLFGEYLGRRRLIGVGRGY